MLGTASARARAAMLAASLGLAALGAVAGHAASLRAADARSSDARRDVVRLVGTPDLVLSTNARWLRHPSQAEPGAAAADGPLAFDADPAGALVGPPRAILGAGARDPRRPGHGARGAP